MSDTSPYQDYSGYNRSATGPNTFTAPLVANATQAAVLSNGAQATFTTSVFSQGQEKKPFTLEAWVLPHEDNLGQTAILSHLGAYDGLVLTNNKVSFVTKYTSNGECRVEYDLERPRAFHIVGVHTENQNQLYIDGELVGSLEITEEQSLDTYSATGNLVGGQTTTAQKISVNGVAVYPFTLSPENILAHFEAGRDVVDNVSVASSFNGELVNLSRDEATIFSESVWNEDEEWNAGELTNIVVEDDKIRPSLDEAGVSQAATWLNVFDLSFANTTSIYAVTVNWSGKNATVEASVDGVTWENVVRGRNLAIIPSGFNPTDKELEIRVTFAGGIQDDDSHVSSLTVTGFLDGAAPSLATRPVTVYEPGYIGVGAEPIEYDSRNGLRLPPGSHAVIGVDTEDTPVHPRTVEVWLRIHNLGINGRFIDTRDATHTGYGYYGADGVGGWVGNGSWQAVYRNAVIDSSGNKATEEEWSLFHFVSNSPIDTPILLNKAYVAGYGSDISVGQVVLYEAALSAADVSKIYKSYTGMPTVTITDSSSTTLTNDTFVPTIVSHDWSITGAGG